MIIGCKGLKICKTRIEIGLCFFLIDKQGIISMTKTTDHIPLLISKSQTQIHAQSTQRQLRLIF